MTFTFLRTSSIFLFGALVCLPACGSSNDSGSGGKSSGGTSSGGTHSGGSGGTSAGGTSAGGTSAGGTSAGGTSAGGTSAGGTAGSSSGGSAGSSSGGSAGGGGKFACGDANTTCDANQLCVKKAGGPGFQYSCVANPCTGQKIDCACAGTLCGGDPYKCTGVTGREVSCECPVCA